MGNLCCSDKAAPIIVSGSNHPITLQTPKKHRKTLESIQVFPESIEQVQCIYETPQNIKSLQMSQLMLDLTKITQNQDHDHSNRTLGVRDSFDRGLKSNRSDEINISNIIDQMQNEQNIQTSNCKSLRKSLKKENLSKTYNSLKQNTLLSPQNKEFQKKKAIQKSGGGIYVISEMSQKEESQEKSSNENQAYNNYLYQGYAQEDSIQGTSLRDSFKSQSHQNKETSDSNDQAKKKMKSQKLKNFIQQNINNIQIQKKNHSTHDNCKMIHEDHSPINKLVQLQNKRTSFVSSNGTSGSKDTKELSLFDKKVLLNKQLDQLKQNQKSQNVEKRQRNTISGNQDNKIIEIKNQNLKIRNSVKVQSFKNMKLNHEKQSERSKRSLKNTLKKEIQIAIPNDNQHYNEDNQDQ